MDLLGLEFDQISVQCLLNCYFFLEEIYLKEMNMYFQSYLFLFVEIFMVVFNCIFINAQRFPFYFISEI